MREERYGHCDKRKKKKQRENQEAFELGPNGEIDNFQKEKSGECIRGKEMRWNPEQGCSRAHFPQTTEKHLEGAATPKEPHQPWEHDSTKGGSENAGFPGFSTRAAAPSGVTAGE